MCMSHMLSFSSFLSLLLLICSFYFAFVGLYLALHFFVDEAHAHIANHVIIDEHVLLLMSQPVDHLPVCKSGMLQRIVRQLGLAIANLIAATYSEHSF